MFTTSKTIAMDRADMNSDRTDAAPTDTVGLPPFD